MTNPSGLGGKGGAGIVGKLLLISVFWFMVGGCSTDEEYILSESTGKYYKFHNKLCVWHKAVAACRNEGAELALPTNNTEVEALVELFKRYPRSVLPTDVIHYDHVMIGFNDAYVEGEYLDQKGKPLIFTKWGSGEPNNIGGKENCGSMNRLGFFNDILCTVPFVFICEKEYKPKEIVPNTVIFYSFGFNQRYSLHISPRNWTDASAICKKENSTLAIINNEEEAQLLVRALSLYPEESLEGSHDKTRVFLGLHNLHFKGEFVTDQDDLAEPQEYNKWGDVERFKSLCGAMRRDGLLTGIDCDVPAMFICERPEKLTSVKSVSVQRRFESAEQKPTEIKLRFNNDTVLRNTSSTIMNILINLSISAKGGFPTIDGVDVN